MPEAETDGRARADDNDDGATKFVGNDNVDEPAEAETDAIGVKCVLLDIEGTICPITFVKQTLFPYALRALPSVLATKWNAADFIPYRDAFPEPARSSPATLQAYVEQLTREDRKDACHKNLQGYLWENGYETGAYATPLFPDVAPRLKEWKGAGLSLAIYSSGSVFAQKLLFGHVGTPAGEVAEEGNRSNVNEDVGGVGEGDPVVGEKRSITDVEESTSDGVATQQPPSKKIATGSNDDDDGGAAAAETAAGKESTTEDLQYLISAWFDTTNAGPKKESTSYAHIAKTLNLEPAEILFLTDSMEEYDAATTAGCEAGLMMRPGNPCLRKEDERPKLMRSLDDAKPLAGNDGRGKTGRQGKGR